MKTVNRAPNGGRRHEAGRGPPSCSSTAIRRRRAPSRASSTGRSGRRFRLVAVDLPGHGASDDAKDPSAYSLPGHARAVRAAVDALGLDEARFVGWSLGGHVALEMAPDLPRARGFVIFGTPPITSGEDDAGSVPAQSGDEIHLPGEPRPRSRRPPMSPRSSGRASPIFRRSSSKMFCARTGGRAAISAPASATATSATRARSCAISKSRSPCCTAAKSSWSTAAISLRSPCRPCGAARCRPFPDAGHTPQWETPEAFDALIEAFVNETA